jgi:hypothetical protein
MTETAGIITHMVKGSGKYESVGGPIPNTEMKVVHPETRSSLAARQSGEICVRGPQVREREGESFQILLLSILSSGVVILCDNCGATSCRLTYSVNVTHSDDRPSGWWSIGGKLLVGVAR